MIFKLGLRKRAVITKKRLYLSLDNTAANPFAV